MMTTPPHSSAGPPTPSTAPLPPYPWYLYNTPPLVSSPYPIVTLPRSQRKKSPSSSSRSSSFFGKLMGKKQPRLGGLDQTPPIYYINRPKLLHPGQASPFSRSSSSC